MKRYDGFANRLALLMREEKMSQRELARRLGITASAVGAWLNSRSFPILTTLYELLDVFEVSAEWLLGLTPEDEREAAK